MPVDFSQPLNIIKTFVKVLFVFFFANIHNPKVVKHRQS